MNYRLKREKNLTINDDIIYIINNIVHHNKDYRNEYILYSVERWYSDFSTNNGGTNIYIGITKKYYDGDIVCEDTLYENIKAYNIFNKYIELYDNNSMTRELFYGLPIIILE